MWLPAPLLRILLRNIEVQVAIVYAGLDHRTLEPLVEGGNRDPVGIAAECTRPTLAIRRAVFTLDEGVS